MAVGKVLWIDSMCTTDSCVDALNMKLFATFTTRFVYLCDSEIGLCYEIHAMVPNYREVTYIHIRS